MSQTVLHGGVADLAPAWLNSIVPCWPHPCSPHTPHTHRDGNPDALSRAQEEIKTTMQVAANIESLVQKVLGV